MTFAPCAISTTVMMEVTSSSDTRRRSLPRTYGHSVINDANTRKDNVNADINPITAPACKVSGLKDARTRLQTVFFSDPVTIYFQCTDTSTNSIFFRSCYNLLSMHGHVYKQYFFPILLQSTFNARTRLQTVFFSDPVTIYFQCTDTSTNSIFFRSCYNLLSMLYVSMKIFEMPVRKRRQKSLKVSNFSLILVFFKGHHGS